MGAGLAEPVTRMRAVPEVDRLAVHQQQVDLGVWDADSLDDGSHPGAVADSTADS